MRALSKKRGLQQEGSGYRIFTVINTLFLCLVVLITAYPMWYVVVASISDPATMAVNYGLIWLPHFPLSINAYKMVFDHPAVLNGYANTFFIVFVGLIFNMIFTCLGAYFMSLKNSLLRKPISALIVFTMYFSGGMVPAYLNIQSLGLMNSTWALIIPGAINTFNMLILRTAFYSIPDSLTEAATLDGAGHFRILTQIFIPLSSATLAVMVLYYAVGHWNSWFNASIYIQDPKKFPLQLVLRQILILNVNNDFNASMGDSDAAIMREMIKYSLIVVSTAPILLLYPFLQRFFTKGVMVGAVKG